MSILLLTLLACTADKIEEEKAKTEQFANDTSVLITQPTNGEVVEANFVLQYEAGVDISTLEFHVDNEYVNDLDSRQNSTSVSLEAGNHKISIIGPDQNDVWLSNPQSPSQLMLEPPG